MFRVCACLIRSGVRVLDAIPKLPSGKIRKCHFDFIHPAREIFFPTFFIRSETAADSSSYY